MPRGESSGFTDKIDPRIAAALAEVEDEPYFHKSEVLQLVCSERKLSNILSDVRVRFPGWDIDVAIIDAIQKRLDGALQRKRRVVSPEGEEYSVRVYECYAAGESERRWKPLGAMTLPELRVCVQAKRRHVASVNAVIKAYERAIDLMERLGADTVQEVFVPAFGEMVAETD